ncbi:MAG: hypothetical protein IT168_21765 [Bryobacterales bacterium]|nr:hypothetical protein [Bryobacterales bacterium]
MSKYKNNINPDYYKTRGREPQGRDVVHQVERAQYAEAAVREKRNDPKDGKEDALPPEDISDKLEGGQGSNKMGLRSSSQKAEEVSHKFASAPHTHPTPGAFGGRPDQPDEEPDTWGGEGGAGDHDPSKTRS